MGGICTLALALSACAVQAGTAPVGAATPAAIATPPAPPAAAVAPVAQPIAPMPTASTPRRSRRVKSPSGGAVAEGVVGRAALLGQTTGQADGVIGDNGTVMYAYGQSRPTIHCAPLHLCVIELMHGESITDISVGDSVRWKVASSRAGDMPVLVLKPSVMGIETNLTVLTDQGRVYYMTLRSAAQGVVPLVQFFSPEDIVNPVNPRNGQIQAQQSQEKHDATLGKLDPATLDFAYTCTGKDKAAFKPVQVFSGSGHIYLKMPEDMQYHDAPVVFDTSADSTQLINSRYVRGYEVLDGLPEKFRLAAGVGSEAQTVECAHAAGNASSSSNAPSSRNDPRNYGG